MKNYLIKKGLFMINIIEQDILILKIETFTKDSNNKEINVLKEERYSLKIFLNIGK
ncbi:hypothetical protein [Thomasclavelia cocleata]|uniref:hypothetical protein n=1 Tax=Thomasclavelia cocleata TaxID=69824 RepID=UPI00248BF43F|nr:hypothetical protein [Thomasclavelia cocleata]